MMKSLTFLPEHVKRARSALRTMFGGFVGKEADDAKPIFSGKHTDPWKDGRGYWRRPNGRFAKRPAPGERAASLELRGSS
ncbi:MAG: hypothetical protein P4M11_06100 [Candidatus Pacebacteria bacterium]|nr:hypothetical protein [Candidatus Paceibacterota bacterium]